MKYFLTCGLGLALLLTPSLAQKAKNKPKVASKVTTSIQPKAVVSTTTKKNAVAPVLGLDPLRYDFGKIKDDGKSISHTFLFKNERTVDLVIENVAPG